MNDRHSFNANVIEQFRANGGKVAGPWGDGNLLLLHTTGAKSGRPRLNPAVYFRVGDNLLFAGTFAGFTTRTNGVSPTTLIGVMSPSESYGIFL